MYTSTIVRKSWIFATPYKIKQSNTYCQKTKHVQDMYNTMYMYQHTCNSSQGKDQKKELYSPLSVQCTMYKLNLII